ncbi:hypothetical protein [Telluribacter humicola]|uniref:hypothetical protein n=1 Tax=Telluribacter humicola TaxID=1720261 RepID=UPI001A95639B|nr:hypothetical protein [Telluribacter humicola]
MNQAKVDPFNQVETWHLIQETLIKQISKIEYKIRNIKYEIKELNLSRKNPQRQLSKDESNIVKSSLDYLDYKLEEYRRLIKIYKSIGDSVAFTFIHKLDIKPQNFKQSSGFITDKVGFRREKQMFRQAFKMGSIAILNDLTSVLKYCDITLVLEGGFVPIEVKSSKNKNARVKRQESNANKLFSYIFTDTTDSLYGIEGIMHRVSIQSQEINYIQVINKLIESSKKNGYAYKLVEPGVLYFVAHQAPNNKEDSKSIFKECNIVNPTAFFLNTMKFNELGYYPFSLSIATPENYFDFLQGKFVINIFIDFNIVSQLAQKYGFTFHERNDLDYPYEFKNLNEEENLNSFKISSHYFGRIIIEFVSLNWLLSEAFEKYSRLSKSDMHNSGLGEPNRRA